MQQVHNQSQATFAAQAFYEKLLLAQLLKKNTRLYGIQRFIVGHNMKAKNGTIFTKTWVYGVPDLHWLDFKK
jgi:hypothetical protein